MSSVEEKAGLPVIDFADLAAWERWLGEQPRDSKGLWLKIAKQGNAASTLTKSDAIDAALAHGWIDGQLDKYDDAWFLTRFTPRRPKGKWSAVNVKRAEALIAAGRMAPAGQAEVDAAKADGRWAAAYAPASTAEVPDDLAAALAVDPVCAARSSTNSTAPTAMRSSIARRMRRSPKPVPPASPNSSRCARRARPSIRANANN